MNENEGRKERRELIERKNSSSSCQKEAMMRVSYVQDNQASREKHESEENENVPRKDLQTRQLVNQADSWLAARSSEHPTTQKKKKKTLIPFQPFFTFSSEMPYVFQRYGAPALHHEHATQNAQTHSPEQVSAEYRMSYSYTKASASSASPPQTDFQPPLRAPTRPPLPQQQRG